MFADSHLSVRLESGSLIQFLYPRHNFTCVATEQRELRRVRVDRVVDFRDEAPDGSYPMEPHLRRGKLLVVGYDLDKHETRRFYVESMTELRPLDLEARPQPRLRTVIVDAEESQFVRFTEMEDPRQVYCDSYNDLDTGRVAVPA